MFSFIFLLFFNCHIIKCQFPNHMDLQKVGEVIFKNEKYNVFKPSIHMVTDYFKDFMMRRESTDIPTKRIFVDNNGFRHYWTNFEEDKNNVENLRKSEAVKATPETKIENDKVTEIASTNISMNVTESPIAETTKVRPSPRRRKKAKYKAVLRSFKKQPLRTGKKVVKTTFFCPFFGVITMRTFID